VEHDVTIIGEYNPRRKPCPITPARCRQNITAFCCHLVKDGKLQLNLQDEIPRENAGDNAMARSERAKGNFSRCRRAGRASREEGPDAKLRPGDKLYVFLLAAFIGFEVIAESRRSCILR